MYEQQMEMFQEGGAVLNDEGGEVEEMSGNEVPLGGVKEGVADDQPANLSAGEMVLSEDVVRYHGVEKIMALRDEAKMGYHKMEAMGQLGNADEATIPTEAIFNPGGMPFSVVDLEYMDMDDDVDVAEAANGMYVQDMQTGGVVQSAIDPVTGLPSMTSIPGVSPTSVSTPNVPTNIVAPPATTPAPTTSTPAANPTIVTPSAPVTQQPIVQGTSPLPNIQQFLGGAQSVNYYIGETGKVIQIPVVNGRQIYETPVGFQPYDPLNPVPFDPDLEEDVAETPGTIQPAPEQQLPDVGGGGMPDDFQGGVNQNVGNALDAISFLDNPIDMLSVINASNTGTFSTSLPNFVDNLVSQFNAVKAGEEGKVGQFMSKLSGVMPKGPAGLALSLLSPKERKDLDSIETALKAVQSIVKDPKDPYDVLKDAEPREGPLSQEDRDRLSQAQADREQAERESDRDRSDDDFDFATLGGTGRPSGTGAGPNTPFGLFGSSYASSLPELEADAAARAGGRPAPTPAELAAGEAAGMAEGFGTPAGTEAAAEAEAASLGFGIAKGGLIKAQAGTVVPKIKFKSKPENRRKGLAARK